MYRYLLFFASYIFAVLPCMAQPTAQSQYNSYQKQHEQTVRAYSSSATPTPAAPVYKSSSSSNNTNSSSSGSYSNSQRTYGSSTNTTRPSSAAATDDDDEDYKPLTRAELDEMKLIKEEKARAAADAAFYSSSNDAVEAPARSSASSSPAEVLRPTLLVMYDGTSGTYLEQKLPNGNTWQGLYVNDRPSNGRLKYANGVVFLGNFNADGKRALGRQTSLDGSVYEGTFYADGYFARGTYKFPTGDSFTGEFNKNQLYRGVYENNGETKRGEFYPNSQLKVGKIGNGYGFYNEAAKPEGYHCSISNRDPAHRLDERIGSNNGGTEAIHLYTGDGSESIHLRGQGVYKQIGLSRKATGEVKYFGITQNDKVVLFTDADKQQAIEAADAALSMIAKGRAAYMEAVKWDVSLLPPGK